jgi:putative transcriptional regulator
MVGTMRMTLAEIQASGGGRVDWDKLDATTEEDIRQQMIEDGEDPDGPLLDYKPVPNVQAIRERLAMSQEVFARTIGVPVATLRNWEQRRTGIAPAARTLLRILEREPEAALRALAG